MVIMEMIIQEEKSQQPLHNEYPSLNAIANLLTKSIVNRNFTKLILQNANLPLILLLQDVVDKSCLARPEEAGDDGDGGEFVLFAVGHGGDGFVAACGGEGENK